MPIKPLTTVAAVLVPLAAAGALAVSADSSTEKRTQRTPTTSAAGDRVKRTTTPATTANTPQLTATDQIRPGVVRIVGRHGHGQSSGTGFVVDAAKGYVVTNAHVISGVSAIKATVGGSQVPARLVATAPCDDLAVLQLANIPAGTRALKLADSTTVRAGQHVRALGFPASLDSTQMSVTEGTVSAAGVTGQPGGDLPNYTSTIQHQAPINPGNSGGPLVDDAGNVVGVNTLSSSTTQGQFYAITSDHLESVLPGLLAGKSKDDIGWTLTQAGNLSFSWQGDYAADWRQAIVDKELGEHMYAKVVQPGSPAALAGVQPGDLITAVEGSPVASFGDICDVLQSRAAGQTVSVSAIAVDRDDDTQPFTPLRPLALKLR